MFKVKALEERYNLARLAGAQFVVVSALHIRIFFMIPYDIVPITASLSILAIILGVIRGNFFYVTDRGRDWVIEHTENSLIIVDNKYGYLDANPAAKEMFPELIKLEKSQMVPSDVIKLFYDYSFCVDMNQRHYVKEVETITQKNRTIGYSLLLIDNTEHHNLLEQVEEEKERAEAEKMDIILDEYEPMSTFHDLSMVFLNRIGEKPVELLYDIDVNLPQKLYGDRQRIRQVIINLMNNGIKFTDEGFVKLSVETKQIDVETLEVTYRIEDSG